MTMLATELQINMFRIEDVAVVVVHGEMDVLSAPSIAATLASLDPDDHVYVDCADVDFVDSEGLRPLITLARRNLMAGAPLNIRASSALRRIIDAAGEEHLFSFD